MQLGKFAEYASQIPHLRRHLDRGVVEDGDVVRLVKKTVSYIAFRPIFGELDLHSLRVRTDSTKIGTAFTEIDYIVYYHLEGEAEGTHYRYVGLDMELSEQSIDQTIMSIRQDHPNAHFDFTIKRERSVWNGLADHQLLYSKFDVYQFPAGYSN